MRLVLWTQHAHDQPAVAAVTSPQVQAALDAVVFVSRWQQQCYAENLQTGNLRSMVLRNAVGPAFAALAEAGPADKAWPPVLVYTSTPFRGLDVLLDGFEHIRAAIPDVRLQVFSSMRVYQVGAADDEAKYGRLYERCRSAPGVEYVGSQPQAQLAESLRAATMLAYPSTFAETSCIALAEAMAAGCYAVTTDLGALSETAAGWATLVDYRPGDPTLAERFAEAVVHELIEIRARPAEAAEHRARQQAYMAAECTWPHRAAEWSKWLAELGEGQ